MKNTLIFGIGFVVGATCSILFAKKKDKEVFEDDFEEIYIPAEPEEPSLTTMNRYREILDSVRAENESPSDDEYTIHPCCKDVFEDGNGHDKVALYWYTKDDMLVDMFDDVSPDALDEYRALGDEWKEHIGDEEQDTAYMMNEKSGKDYMIIKVEASFHELAGYDGEEPLDG